MNNKKKLIIILFIVILFTIISVLYFVFTQTYGSPSEISESEAKIIAEQNCLNNDEFLREASFYNSNTKTWWFDVDLKSKPDNCNPACVVSEETKTAEINWRCGGLIAPEENTKNTIEGLFAEKYPKYSDTLSVRIDQSESDYIRGLVIFEQGAPGGIFFAKKFDTRWMIVHEGNGAIPCLLSDYGFPKEMLTDCSDR